MPDRAVVADATVLIFLGKLRRLDWLHAAYKPVLIPTEVHKEVVVNGKELGARDAVLVENAIDNGWIEVHEIDPRESVAKYDLEAGETEVLSLALASRVRGGPRRRRERPRGRPVARPPPAWDALFPVHGDS